MEKIDEEITNSGWIIQVKNWNIQIKLGVTGDGDVAWIVAVGTAEKLFLSLLACELYFG